jgi:DNA-binding ferritin-like protein (Dps family)
MTKKPPIVLDTNYIISYRADFANIHKRLSETYNVFITDVSIQERVSQIYIDYKEKYNKIEKFRADYSDFVEIKIRQSFEEIYEITKRKVEKSYQDLFGDNIIKFIEKENSLKLIMDRVYKKIPPFSIVENASDKGFKDTMIWLSMLEYFKDKVWDNVIFVTNDKVFRNNSDALCNEFTIFTGKKMEIKDNKYFETPVLTHEEFKANIFKPLPDVSLLRSKIQEYVSAICFEFNDYDQWGNPEFSGLFKLHKILTADDIKKIFENLNKVIEENIFETSIYAETVFCINGFENKSPIPITALQDALSLFIDIHNECKEYLPQFYYTVANIFNRNYDDSDWFSNNIPF